MNAFPAPWRTGPAVLAAAATGLVAGVHLSGIPLVRALRTLDAAGWTTTKQALDVSFPVLMKPLLLTALVLLAAATAAAALGRRRGTAVASGIALAASAVVLVATVRGDLPLNQEMAGWDPAAPPADWVEVRAAWERWFAVRTVASTAAFAASLAALVTAVGSEARPTTP